VIKKKAIRRWGSSSGGIELTVVIPVWDAYVRWLPNCVETIRRQVPQARIVVVDNASTVALPALSFDVDVLRVPARRSVGAARNLGLADARTPDPAAATVSTRIR